MQLFPGKQNHISLKDQLFPMRCELNLFSDVFQIVRNLTVAVTHRQTFLYCVFMDNLHIYDFPLATRTIHQR